MTEALLERETELGVLDQALHGVRAGRGSVVVVEAAPGLGKTTLLRHAQGRAEELGLVVLSARGAEVERDFTFGLVQQLLGLPASATWSTEIFAGPAKTVEALLTARCGPQQKYYSWYAILHGLYWVVVNLARTAPVVILVDDTQWGDLPSLRFVSFLAHRLHSLPVALVIVSRAEEGDVVFLEDIVTAGDVVVLEPASLSPAGVTELVRRSLGDDAADEFCSVVHTVTGGNPLFVRELLRGLSAQHVRPDAAAAASVEAAGPDALRRYVLGRLRRQPGPVVAVARAVAVLGDDTELTVVAQVADVPVGEAASAAAQLVLLGVFASADPPAFVHAFVRDVLLSQILPDDRSALHDRAADVLAAAGRTAEGVAAHLLHTIPEGNGGRVTVLLAAAQEARQLGALTSAAVYLRRAREEPPPPDLKSEVNRLLGNCEIHLQATQDAEAHLREALALADTRAQRSMSSYSLARVRNALSGTTEAVELLATAVRELPPDTPQELAAELVAELVGITRIDIRSRAQFLDHFAAFRRMPGRQVAVEDAQSAIEKIFAGEPADQGVALARRALAHLRPDRTAIWPAVLALVVADHLDEAERCLDRVLDGAVHRGLLFPTTLARSFLAMIAFLRGEVTVAADHVTWADGALRSSHIAAPLLQAVQAQVLIEQGRLADAEVVVTEGALPEGFEPTSGLQLWLLDARIRLRVAQGNPSAALADAEIYEQACGQWGALRMPHLRWRLHAAEAWYQLGHREQAEGLVAEELRIARHFGRARPLGVALRVAARLARTEAEARRLLDESIGLLEQSPARLEHARAVEQLGTLLIAEGDRVAGARVLSRAAEMAEACGATAMAERLTGHRDGVRRDDAGQDRPAELGSCTPAERQVAELATTGLTNRQIATRLRLSEKTVEAHLSRVYRKLGIRSRTQLAVRMTGAGRPGDSVVRRRRRGHGTK